MPYFPGAFGFDRNISRWDVRKVTDSQKWGGDQNGANGHPDLHFRDSHVLDKYFTIKEGLNQWLDLYVRTYQDTYDLGPVKVSEMATTGREVTSNRGRLENIDGSTAGHANLDKVEIYSSDGHTYYLRFKHINGNYYHIGTNASSNTIEDGGSGFGGYHYRRHSAYVGFVETPSGQENNMNGMEFYNQTTPKTYGSTTVYPLWPHNLYLTSNDWNSGRIITLRGGWRLDKSYNAMGDDWVHIFSAGPQTAAPPIQPYYVYEFYISAQSHYHVGLGPHIQQCLVDGVLYPPTGDVSIFADPDHSGALLDMFEDGGQAAWTYCPAVGEWFMTITLSSRPSFLGLHMVVPCMDQGGE